MSNPLRCGRIAYTNDLPLYAAFDAGAETFPGELIADVPQRLNALLKAGELDMGPVSVAHYARHPERYVILDDICIGSRRDVWSVLLISKTPPALLQDAEIAVTRESASGRALLQILLERRYNVRASFVTHEDPVEAARMQRPALLIGDRAIDARLAFRSTAVHDLGRLWNEWTGLDMVYAVWVARRSEYETRRDEIDAGMDAIRRAAAWGRAHRAEVIGFAQAVHPRPDGFYDAYYDTLNYDFDPAARAGFARYLSELGAVGLMPAEVAGVRS